MYLKYITILLIVTLVSCQKSVDPLDSIANPEVREILEKAFNSAGGLESYQSIDSVIYRKKTVLYLEDGSIESEVEQLHQYKLSPHLSGTISWTDSSGNHEIYHSMETSFKSFNGNVIEGSEASAIETFYSNYYVLFIPFKLLDPGVQLSYTGNVRLEDGRQAEVIEAIYSPATFDNHSTSDSWQFYFDAETGKVLANLVYHEPTYAYIVNIETTEKYPIRLNLYRRTWRTDAERNKKYLRGEFWYSDYHFTKIQ